MKNILKAVVVTAAMVGMSGGVVLADSVTCSGSVTNTGPGSSNTVNCVDNNNNQVTCNNNVVVSTNNNQGASSGSANNSGNTTGGNSTSGSANNSNNVVVNVGVSCAPVAGGMGGEFTATPASSPQVLAENTAVAPAQVATAPAGGVGAGAGAGASSNTVAATTGILASAGVVGLGLALRKRALGN